MAALMQIKRLKLSDNITSATWEAGGNDSLIRIAYHVKNELPQSAANSLNTTAIDQPGPVTKAPECVRQV
jgi:hypothetical protein